MKVKVISKIKDEKFIRQKVDVELQSLLTGNWQYLKKSKES